MSEGDVPAQSGPNIVQAALAFLRSSIGAKFLMAITGAGLWGFVIIHLLGNLQVFKGSEAINHYSETLASFGPGLWIIRSVLIVGLILHIVMGMRLAAMNRAARGPVQYKMRRNLRTNVMSLTMGAGGIIILAFILFHLSHFTLGTGPNPEQWAQRDGQGRHDVYRMVIAAFKQPWIVVVYVIGQLVLFSHLLHGSQSLFQSLGLRDRVWVPILKTVAYAVAILVVAGNVGIPLALLGGWQ